MNILFCITIFLISHPYVLILVSYYIKVSKAMNRSLGTSTLCQTVSTAIFTCYFCNCIPYVFYMFYRRIAIATIFKCSDTPIHTPHSKQYGCTCAPLLLQLPLPPQLRRLKRECVARRPLQLELQQQYQKTTGSALPSSPEMLSKIVNKIIVI